MKLTRKILIEMIRQGLKENAFSKKGGYYARHAFSDDFDHETYRESNQYAVAFEQMEDYYYDYLYDSGASEQEIRKDLASNFHNNNNVPGELALRMLIDDFMADM